MTDFTIRKMTEADTEGVVQIEKSVFSMPWSQKSFIDACESDANIYLVCELNGRIAGYCGLWTASGEGNITNLAVAEEYRRLGIARALMEHIEECACKQGVAEFFLEVRMSNEPAIALYRSMGYEQSGLRRGFYEKPTEDAILMTKLVVRTGHRTSI